MKFSRLILFLFLLPGFTAKAQGDPIRPSIYALVIGVADYKDPMIPDLQFSELDARSFASFLKTPSAGKLPDDHLILLTGSGATRAAIIDQLEDLLIRTGPDDLLIFYFSGHGKNGTLANTGYLLPYDAVDGKQESSSLNMQYISGMIEKSKAKVKLSYIDACHAGLFRLKPGAKGTAADNAEIQKTYYELLTNSVSGSMVFMSSSERQESAELPDKKRGLFTHVLLEGLSGKADRMDPELEGYNDSVVTASELKVYLTTEIHKLSKGKQLPAIDIGTLDLFPLSILNPKVSLYKMMSAVKVAENKKRSANTGAEEKSADEPVEIKLALGQVSLDGACAGKLTIYNKTKTPLVLQSLIQNSSRNRSVYNVNMTIPPKGKATTQKLAIGDPKVPVSSNDCYDREDEYNLLFRWDEMGRSKSTKRIVTVKAGYDKPLVITADLLGIENEPLDGYAEKHPIPAVPEEIRFPVNNRSLVQIDEANTLSVSRDYPGTERILTLVNGHTFFFEPGKNTPLYDPAKRKYNLYYKGVINGFRVFTKVY